MSRASRGHDRKDQKRRLHFDVILPLEFVVLSASRQHSGVAAVWSAATTYKVDDRPTRTVITRNFLSGEDVADRDVREFFHLRVVGTRMVHIPFWFAEQHEEIVVERIQEMAFLRS